MFEEAATSSGKSRLHVSCLNKALPHLGCLDFLYNQLDIHLLNASALIQLVGLGNMFSFYAY